MRGLYRGLSAMPLSHVAVVEEIIDERRILLIMQTGQVRA